MKNPYEVLGLKNNATMEEIKLTFRRLAKQTHPDVTNHNEALTEKFRNYAEAYAILNNPSKKKILDEQLRTTDQKLNKNNFFYDDVKQTAFNYEHYIHQMYAEIKPYKDAALQSMNKGLLWFFGGAIVSLFTYIYALNNNESSYFVFTGAILFGGIQAINGFMKFIKINNLVNDAERKMWDNFQK